MSKTSKGGECQNQGGEIKEEEAADSDAWKQKSSFKDLVNAKWQKTLLANFSALLESLIHKTLAADKQKDKAHGVCRQILC